MCCAATADFVKVFESSYSMCSVCNQTKEPIKEKIVNCPIGLVDVFFCIVMTCRFLKKEPVLFCACVFFCCKVYVFV